MDTLMDATTGRYEVTTKTSIYYVDLDQMVLWRIPRTRALLDTLLGCDDELACLLEIEECTVGKRMLLLTEPHVPGLPATLRKTTIVWTMERIPSPGEDAKS